MNGPESVREEGKKMGHYQPLEIVKYQHGYEADFSIEAEYKQRLESAAAVVTVLHPLLDCKRGGKQSNIRSSSWIRLKWLAWLAGLAVIRRRFKK